MPSLLHHAIVAQHLASLKNFTKLKKSYSRRCAKDGCLPIDNGADF